MCRNLRLLKQLFGGAPKNNQQSFIVTHPECTVPHLKITHCHCCCFKVSVRDGVRIQTLVWVGLGLGKGLKC